MTRPTARRGPPARDPFGWLAERSWWAPAASIGGLLIVAWLTLGLLNGAVPFAGGDGGSTRTAAPVQR